MDSVMEVMKLLNCTFIQLASKAVERYGEKRHIIAWLVRAYETGSLPGMVKDYCEEVLTKQAVKVVAVTLRPAA